LIYIYPPSDQPTHQPHGLRLQLDDGLRQLPVADVVQLAITARDRDAVAYVQLALGQPSGWFRNGVMSGATGARHSQVLNRRATRERPSHLGIAGGRALGPAQPRDSARFANGVKSTTGPDRSPQRRRPVTPSRRALHTPAASRHEICWTLLSRVAKPCTTSLGLFPCAPRTSHRSQGASLPFLPRPWPLVSPAEHRPHASPYPPRLTCTAIMAGVTPTHAPRCS
jgi:hypothetical protein